MKMNDLNIAKSKLEDHSICLCKNGFCFTDDGRGISPVMNMIERGIDLRGYSAADIIVGKAAAMLFVKAGIVSVYGRIMSESGMEFLKNNCITISYDELTDRIINRSGTDICPMEKTVLDINDPDIAYTALKDKLAELKKEAENG